MQTNQAAYAGAPADVGSTGVSLPPLHILVADDDPAIRRLNTAVLMHAGYEVDDAGDGAAAWRALHDTSYDLLITDNRMPKVTGVELLKKLRAARMELPVIMATSSLPEHEFAQHPWLIPEATLLKPYTIADLLRAVMSVLGTTEDSPAPQRSRPAHAAHNILAVDQDHDLLQLYGEVLAAPRYQVDGAEDGTAGWEALQTGKYHLVITEHELPDLNGIELVRKLRTAHLDLPVVMAAARLPRNELAQDPLLRLAATLAKPFSMDILVATVENILRASNRSPSGPVHGPTPQTRPSSNGL